MKITLGLALDDQRAIRPSNRLGDTDVGPLGLLGLLETYLGLQPPSSGWPKGLRLPAQVQ